jgi:predicted RNA-binding protein YlxR (DUF448 family)/ribosomal protein L30E
MAAHSEAAAASETERRCLVTGAVRPKTALVRFVVGPDGAVVPDVAASLPGRGLWLTARRDIVEAAVAKRLFGRAAREPVQVSGDLADRVELLLRRRCGDLIGLARRSGKAVAGYEKVRAALRDGEAAVLLAAADGGESGREKVRAAGPDLPLVDVLTAAELGAAFGREHVVHAVVGRGRLAKALLIDAARLVGFRVAPEELEIGRERQQRRRRNADDGTGSR